MLIVFESKQTFIDQLTRFANGFRHQAEPILIRQHTQQLPGCLKAREISIGE
jgi:hypothetical protein